MKEKIIKGSRIRTVYGKWYTAIDIWDNVITVTDSIQKTVHISKVVEVK